MRPSPFGRPNRRGFTLMMGACLLTGGRGSAAAPPRAVGGVKSATGNVFAQIGETRALTTGAEILLGDLVWTEEASRVALALEGGSNVHLGAKARLKIDRFVAASGGTLVLGDGGMVFDREAGLPKTDITVRSVFGQIGIRGTRFFVGPSKGVFAVFCEHGEVRVTAAGEERVLMAGDGVDIEVAGQAPSPVKQWGKARIDAAFAGVLG